MHTSPTEDAFNNYGSNADAFLTIARCGIKCLNAAKTEREYAKRTQAKVQRQVEETLVVMLQPGSHASSNGIKTASVQFSETLVPKLFGREADDDIRLNCLEVV